MLKWKIGIERRNLGYDPDTELPIDSIDYYVVAIDESGNQWRHTETFSTKFEVVNEIGMVVYHSDRQARRMAEHLIEEFKLKGLAEVSGLDEWYEL
jgi:hypothetical protein